MSQVDRDVLWRRLELTKTQVARLTGLSRRQIVYWSSKGLIGRPGRKTFDGPAVENVLRIKEALARGARLRDAAQATETVGESLSSRRTG
jgi:DNA-binding transcriptional MerR regulator